MDAGSKREHRAGKRPPLQAGADPWLGISDDVVQRFLDVMLVQRQLSVRTCAKYRVALLRLDRWLQRFHRCTLVTADDRQLVRYLASWARGRESLRKLSGVTLTFRRFYAHLCDSHLRDDNPMLTPLAARWNRRRPTTATKQLQRESREAATERDRVMLALMIAADLRLAQLTGLRIADLHLHEGYLSLRGQPSVDQVFLRPALVDMLQRFLLGSRHALLKGRESTHVFPAFTGRALTGQEFWRACRRKAAFAEERGGSGRLRGWRSGRGLSEMASRQGV